jgi:hypothetical protein
MNRRFIDVTRRALDASVVVARVRPAVAGSVVWAAGAAAIRRLRAIGDAITAASSAAQLRRGSLDAPRQFDRMASESGLVAALSSVLAAPSIALREAGVFRLLQPLLDLDLSNRIRVVGCITLVAVITHTLLLALLRVPVHGLGWGMRVALVAASTVAIRWPEPIAAAWSDRFPKRGHVKPDSL